MSDSNTAPARQTADDRRLVLANLPDGTRRVQVLSSGGTHWKSPGDVDVDNDEIVMSKGEPVVMRGKPGRKFKTKLQPVNPNVAKIEEARSQHLYDSPLLKNVKKNSEGDDVLDSILRAMAEEAESIEFERLEAQRNGLETSNLSMRRARVLKGLADTVLNRKKATQGGSINLDSPQFTALFTYLLETVKESMILGGCRAEQIEQTFTRLVGALDESWKQEALTRMKESL